VRDIIVEFVVVPKINARIRSHDRRCDHHTYKGKGNQKVVHSLVSGAASRVSPGGLELALGLNGPLAPQKPPAPHPKIYSEFIY